MWPIQLAFRFLIACRIFLCSLTWSNTYSFLTWSVQLIFSILLQHHISKLSRCFLSTARSVQVSAPYKVHRTENMLLVLRHCGDETEIESCWLMTTCRSSTSTLKMRPVYSSETLVPAYQTTKNINNQKSTRWSYKFYFFFFFDLYLRLYGSVSLCFRMGKLKKKL